jgi:arylsulfatase A-like enzyme
MIRFSVALGFLAIVSTLRGFSLQAEEPRSGTALRPNILFILADDLGYGDLGCYGQKQIQTPNLDRLAAEGIRFTQCYAGSTVCAPSRCSLMTGLHAGHSRIRANSLVPLRPEDRTVAEVLKSAGYATSIIGKWGLGEPGTKGIPNRKGFEYWFGYLNQVHAHNYYPDYLWRNDQRVPIAGNVVKKGVASKRSQYSTDLFTEEALRFLERPRQRPFFLYLAYTAPHANNEAGNNGMEVPSDAPYSDRPWPQPQRNHAAMITRLDADIGRVLKRLKELGLEEKTLVFFSSDNGPHKEGGADPRFFHSSGPLRGYKRDLYEGGIRVPMLARWPSRIKAGVTSPQVWAFWDFLPTAAELAGAKPPEGLDGISMLPALLSEKAAGRPQANHGFLYWEFHERGYMQAVRMGRWKLVRRNIPSGLPVELYDLDRDVGEQHNVAAAQPQVVAQIEAYLKNARTESSFWPAKPGQEPP